jgi:DNA helicase-2/ATP-dependent DNA helicase PcrA
LSRKVILASAGAGKSRYIAEQALLKAADSRAVLILTYTISNQEELLAQICRISKVKPPSIVIKGWFTFLLEDMIRPYQRP